MVEDEVQTVEVGNGLADLTEILALDDLVFWSIKSEIDATQDAL